MLPVTSPASPKFGLRWSGVGRRGGEAAGENSPPPLLPPQRATPPSEEPSKSQAGGRGAPGRPLLAPHWKALQMEEWPPSDRKRPRPPGPGGLFTSMTNPVPRRSRRPAGCARSRSELPEDCAACRSLYPSSTTPQEPQPVAAP